MLEEFWIRNFEDSQPLAYQIRDRYSNRWARFHSLPHAKRYPETHDEWATLLERHNSLVAFLAGNQSKLELLTTNWSSDQEPTTAAAEILQLNLSARPWRTFAKDGDQSNWWHIFHTEIDWKTGVLDPIFRLVADNQISNVMLLDPTDDWMIHPYDGGLDMILRSTIERDTISTRFSSWQSMRCDGL